MLLIITSDGKPEYMNNKRYKSYLNTKYFCIIYDELAESYRKISRLYSDATDHQL